MAANLVAVVFTVIFTRILGTGGYGSLAALLNLTVILFVPGSALQVAAAREGTLGRLGRGGELAGTLQRWTRHILIALVVVVAASIVRARAARRAAQHRSRSGAPPRCRSPPCCGCWCASSAGCCSRRAPTARSGSASSSRRSAGCVVGLGWVALGLGVTGAYLGTASSLALTAIVLEVVLRRRLGPPDGRHARSIRCAQLARDAALPIAALTVVAALQNIDVIMAKHALSDTSAGVYAATVVAAKAVVWIAVGLGFWVVPEATRRAASGADPRTVLARALGVIGVVSVVRAARSSPPSRACCCGPRSAPSTSRARPCC